MEFGKHPQLTYVEGSTSVPISAANLNENERVVENCDNELANSQYFKLKNKLDYFYKRNYKLLESFQDDTSFTAMSSTTVSADTSNDCIGYQATKMLENDNTASDIGMYKSISAFDLTTFNDGGASTTSDFITFAVYLSDYTKFSDLTFKLGTDNTNNYSVSYTPNGWSGAYAYSGWHVVSLPKSDFTSNGTPPAWSNITYIRCQATTVANAQNEYITMQHIALCRVDADNSTYYNVFQEYKGSITGWENVFSPNLYNTDIVWCNYKNTLGILMIAQNNYSGNERALTVLNDVICFRFKAEMISKWFQQTGSLTWYYDANNYIETYVESNNLYLNVTEGGSLTSQNVALINNLGFNERVELELIKNYDSIRATLYKNGEPYKVLEYETTIDSSYDGNLYLGYYGGAGFSFVTDFAITNNNIDDIEGWNVPKILIKTDDESLDSTTTYQYDDELWCYLPPNGLYEVEYNLAVDGSDSGQDIKIKWDTQYTVYNFTNRHGIGAGRGSTDIYDATMYSQVRSLTSDAEYGVVSSGWTNIHEKAIMKTSNDGGGVYLMWAQRVSSATPIIVKAGSYMKITKVKSF